MKNKNYAIILDLDLVDFIFQCLKFLILSPFILMWGLAKSIFEYLPGIQTLSKKLRLHKIDVLHEIDNFFSSQLSDFYNFPSNKIYYLFLLRVPIVSGIVLFTLPLIAQFFVSEFLQNIFVLKDGNELILVMLATSFSAVTIISLSKTILVLIDHNFQDDINSKILRSVLTATLFLPTWVLLLHLNNAGTNLEDIN